MERVLRRRKKRKKIRVFNFKLTKPQKELHTWYEPMIASYYMSRI